MRKNTCILVIVAVLLFPVLMWAQGKKNPPPPVYVEVTTNPTILHEERPYYPDLAVRAGKEGTVHLKMWVDEKGNVADVSIVKSEDEIFDKPAMEAAKKYQFSPAKIAGKPVAVWVTIPFKFRLAKDDAKFQAPSAKGISSNVKPVKTINVDKQVEILYSVPAVYPEQAKKEGAEGEAVVQVLVDESGDAVQVRLVKTDRGDFGEAAVAAVAKWKFKPAMKDNKPLASWVTVPFKFKLDADKKKKK
ncbi:MAG: energy transducer TonB [bacterium]